MQVTQETKKIKNWKLTLNMEWEKEYKILFQCVYLIGPYKLSYMVRHVKETSKFERKDKINGNEQGKKKKWFYK